MIAKIIKHKNATYFIEWRDKEITYRGYAPYTICSDVLDNDTPSVFIEDNLKSLIIPYGVDWEYALQGLIGDITPHGLARRLTQSGIFTIEDVRNNPQIVMGIILASTGLDVNTLIAAASKIDKV